MVSLDKRLGNASNDKTNCVQLCPNKMAYPVLNDLLWKLTASLRLARPRGVSVSMEAGYAERSTTSGGLLSPSARRCAK